MILIGMFDSPYVRRVAISMTLLGLPFFGLLGFVGAVVAAVWLIVSILRSGGGK
jgi:ubiquinone biosynthesis protein